MAVSDNAGSDQRVTALYRYPIKSCAGIAVQDLPLNERGPIFDRDYVIVEASTGMFLTQRKLPRMALIRPAVLDQSAGLRLQAPEMQPLDVPLRADGKVGQVTIWRDTCQAVDQGDEVAEWISSFLGTSLRLVWMPPDEIRQVDQTYATGTDDHVGFADGYPVMVISEESLVDLNQHLDEPLPMNRFRPNIVVAGGTRAFAEDEWLRVRIGDLTFTGVKPCVRCAITTIDQETARRGKEPLTTLARYRQSDLGVVFGRHLIHDGAGTLRVGDHVRVMT